MPLQIIRQDITQMKVDAIVNTTNEKMVGYSGVDLAIHTLAGEKLDEECSRIAPLGLGEAKITDGYNLPSKYIIHTHGPVWKGGASGESLALRSCYIESLKLAVANQCDTVAFPLISSGAYGYPKELVLKFAIQIIKEFLFDHELTVFLCVFDRESYTFSRELFTDIKQFIDDKYVDRHINSYPERFELRSVSMRCNDRIAPRKKRLEAICDAATKDQSLSDYLKRMDKTFAYKLFDLIDESGMTDVECYKKANVDKRTFSKIKSNPQTYKPSKQTAVAFAIALELNLDQTQELLASAGLTLSGSFTFDKIIRYFIQKKIYDVFLINEALFEFDQQLLGV